MYQSVYRSRVGIFTIGEIILPTLLLRLLRVFIRTDGFILRYVELGGTTTFYMNGVSFGTPLADTYNYTNTENLLIANQSTLSADSTLAATCIIFIT